MRCKVQTLWPGETCGENKSITRRSKHACIVEARESARKRTGKTQQKDHEDHIAGVEFGSLSHDNLVHKFVPMLQSSEIPGCESRC